MDYKIYILHRPIFENVGDPNKSAFNKFGATQNNLEIQTGTWHGQASRVQLGTAVASGLDAKIRQTDGREGNTDNPLLNTVRGV